MGVLDKVPFLAGYNEQDQINRAQENQGMMKLSQLMQMQKMQQDMQSYPEDRAMKRRLDQAHIGSYEASAAENQAKTQKMQELFGLAKTISALPDGHPEKAPLVQKYRMLADPTGAMDPTKGSPLAQARAEQAALRPDDTAGQTAYSNMIRKLSETPKQISPTIVMPKDKFSNVRDDGQGGFIGLDREGRMVPIPMGDGAVSKSGTINLAGGRESVQIGRVIQASNQAAKDLENIAKLPLTASSGIFGGRSQGASLFEAAKETLTNTSTTQEVQTYNAMATGMQRNLAAIESAGLMPPGSLTKQMDAVIMKEGDTNLTKMHKLAQARQIIDAAQESMDANPRIPKEQKDHMRTVISRIAKAVPYTHTDLLELAAAQEKNPNATLKSVLASKQQPPATAPTYTGKVMKISGDMEYNALPKGAHYAGPDGVERVK